MLENLIIGLHINPKLFSKLSVKNNVIGKEHFTVEGRKHTLLEIWKNV